MTYQQNLNPALTPEDFAQARQELAEDPDRLEGMTLEEIASCCRPSRLAARWEAQRQAVGMVVAAWKAVDRIATISDARRIALDILAAQPQFRVWPPTPGEVEQLILSARMRCSEPWQREVK